MDETPDPSRIHTRAGNLSSLSVLAALLGLLWILGVATDFTMGGYLHALLGGAIAVFIARALVGRRSPPPK